MKKKPFRECYKSINVWLYLELPLNVPQVFLSLGCLPVSMVQLDLHLVQVPLHLLLHPQSVVPAADLGVQSGLHGLQHSLMVPLHLVDLLVFLR